MCLCALGLGLGVLQVSEPARDLVASLLRPDPSMRLDAAEALRHPFVASPVESHSQALLVDAVQAFRVSGSPDDWMSL